MSFNRFIKRIHGKIEPEVAPSDHQESSDLAQVEDFQSDDLMDTKIVTLSTKLETAFGFKRQMTLDEHMNKIDGMSKMELDEYAKDYDIELDRRQTKRNMIDEFIQKLKEKN